MDTLTVSPVDTQADDSALSKSQPSNDDLYFDFDLTHHPSLPDVVDRLVDWSANCLNGHGQSTALVLAGYSGCGKTHLGRLTEKHFRGGGYIVFIEEPKLLESLRDSYGGGSGQDREKRILSSCQQADILIYDDLGTGHVKDLAWLDDIYWRLFNGRHEVDKATLITTNLSKQDLAYRVGGRTWSRLQEAMANPDNFIEMFDVSDYRGRGW